jgi:eukaryotic-like serine/threonine-protein kinase
MRKCTFCGAVYDEEQKFCPEDGKPLAPFIIDGRYKILYRIGDGGFGEVYAAEHTTIGKKVAVKLLRGAFAKLKEFRQRFEREAKAASRLSHLHCVQVTDFGVVDEGPYLVMEFLEGRPLSALMEKGKIEKKRSAQIGIQILSALSHAHTQGIIHRDLKPDNIMLVNQAGAKGDFVKILDFGLAKMVRDNQSEQKLTQAGMILGTPSYMSPEQAVASESDHRTDIYSIGFVLYEILVGRRPFVVTGTEEILRAHVFTAPTPPRTLNPSLSVEIEAMLLKALAKKKEERFQSAEEFLQALSATPEAQSDEAELAALMQVISPKTPAPIPEPSALLLVTKDIEIGGPSLLVPAQVPTLKATVKAPQKSASSYLPLLIGALFLMVGAGYLLSSNEEAPAVPISTPKITSPNPVRIEAPPTRPTLVLADDRPTKRAEELLDNGDLSALNKEIVQLKTKDPKNARVYYLHGILFYKTDKLYDAIEELTTAVRLNPAYAYDEVLLQTALGGFETNFSRGVAKSFFTKTLPKDIAVETLAKGAATGTTRDVREGAADTLRALGEADKLDQVAKAILDLEQAKYCKYRLDAVRELKSTKDPRALKTLQDLDAQGTRAPLNSCLGDEVQEAITAIQTP